MRKRERMPDDTRAFLRERSREMRRAMTPTERRLWSRLRNDQLDGHRFRRQQPIGPYIADFLCASLKLVVEVDGDSHATAEQVEKDRVRAEYLTVAGLYVMRFANAAVWNDLVGVIAELRGWMCE